MPRTREIKLEDGKLILSMIVGGVKAERFNSHGVWCATGTGVNLHDAILGCYPNVVRGRDRQPWTSAPEKTTLKKVESIVRYIEATKGGNNGAQSG